MTAVDHRDGRGTKRRRAVSLRGVRRTASPHGRAAAVSARWSRSRPVETTTDEDADERPLGDAGRHEHELAHAFFESAEEDHPHEGVFGTSLDPLSMAEMDPAQVVFGPPGERSVGCELDFDAEPLGGRLRPRSLPGGKRSSSSRITIP